MVCRCTSICESAERSGEIIGGDIGLQREQDVFVIGQGGLGLVARSLKRAAHLAPEIDFVTEIERHDRGGVEGVGQLEMPLPVVCGDKLAVIRRGALPGSVPFEIKRGKKIGLGLPGHGARFADLRHCGAQGLVGRWAWASSSFSLESWKIGVPVALGNLVLRLALFPVARFLVVDRLGNRGLDVIGPDGTAGQEGDGYNKTRDKKRQAAREHGRPSLEPLGK